MNIPLLHQLRRAGGAYVAAAELGNDAEACRRDLDELQAFGFGLEQHPVYGVGYRGPAARLCPDQIEWELETRLVGRRVAVWDRPTSTNDLAARASGSSANEGLVVLAESQSSGRGSRGRTWTAPRGSSVLMSILLFPDGPLADPAWLTALGAVAVAEVAEAWTNRPARIKWPNDVRIGGRKVAGVLVERGAGAVVGVGLNANTAADEFPEELRDSATSIRIECGSAGPVDRSELARDLIRTFDRWYASGIELGAGPVAIAWLDRFEHSGRRVRVETTEGPRTGRLAGADLRTGVILVEDNGEWVRIPSASIVAVGEPGPERG